MNTPRCLQWRGFTLVETLTVVAILAILASLAAPSFIDYLARQRLTGAANELVNDLHFAKTESVQRNLPVTVAFNTTGYSVAQGANPAFKTVVLDSGNSVSSGSTLTATFDPVRGTASLSATPGAVVLANSKTSGTLQVTVSAIGRPTVCSPSGAIKGYPTC